MRQGLIVLLFWMILGFSLDLLVSEMTSLTNASSVVEFHFLTASVFVSLFHCFYLSMRNKRLDIFRLLPSIIVFIVMLDVYVTDYFLEASCVINQNKSHIVAKKFIEKLSWEQKYLIREPMKFKGCKLGFEYNSTEHFRLVIVSQDGSVRLNE